MATNTKQHGGTDESYLLPHNTDEYRRLDTQSEALYKLMGDRHVHVPVREDATLLLDIGCGLGNVSESLAKEHPSAKVIGVDLAPVPIRGPIPGNLGYLQGNVIEQAGHHPDLQYNSADLVYSRLLIAGLKGGLWPTFVETLFKLVKPGGYLNMVDVQFKAHQCTDYARPIQTRKPVANEVLEDLCAVGVEQGFDFEGGAHLEKYMKDAGFVDVQVHMYPWPLGTSIAEKLPAARGLVFDGQAKGLSTAFTKVYYGMISDEEVEVKRKAFEDLIDSGHVFCILHAVTGRKP